MPLRIGPTVDFAFKKLSVPTNSGALIGLLDSILDLDHLIKVMVRRGHGTLLRWARVRYDLQAWRRPSLLTQTNPIHVRPAQPIL